MRAAEQYTNEAIDAFVARLDRAQADLTWVLSFLCPGPHQPRQHRDRRLPWCNACRRDLRGATVPRDNQPTTEGNTPCRS